MEFQKIPIKVCQTNREHLNCIFADGKFSVSVKAYLNFVWMCVRWKIKMWKFSLFFVCFVFGTSYHDYWTVGCSFFYVFSCVCMFSHWAVSICTAVFLSSLLSYNRPIKNFETICFFHVHDACVWCKIYGWKCWVVHFKWSNRSNSITSKFLKFDRSFNDLKTETVSCECMPNVFECAQYFCQFDKTKMKYATQTHTSTRTHKR